MITISTILRDKKVTPKQIVKTCQVSHVTACSWIRGATVPNRKHIRDLAKLSHTHYSRILSAREASTATPRAKSTQLPRGKSVATKVPPTVDAAERRCYLMKAAVMYTTLSSDEKVVVAMMADALALLDKGGE
tara:strand:+ start:1195 stop:1593 length:399 start_codon:yes stop_codon:yes gene_type:complete